MCHILFSNWYNNYGEKSLLLKCQEIIHQQHEHKIG